MGRASREKRQVEPDRRSGADPWYVAEGKRGQQLLASRELDRAAHVFDGMLSKLGRARTYARAVVLGQLGRCRHLGGERERAAAHLQEAMEIAAGLVPSDELTALRASLLSEMGNVLRAADRRVEARHAHEAALALAETLNDARARGVELSHLAALDLADGRAGCAREGYAKALEMFLLAGEPVFEAHTRRQLANILKHDGQAQEAERQYLEAARIHEAQGDLPAAAQTWTALGAIREDAGDALAAEAWYRKVVEAGLKQRSVVPLSDGVARLARVLLDQPRRLGEARQLALQALSLARRHDPASSQVWEVHGLLADLDDREASADTTADERRDFLRAQARGHRHLASLAPRIMASARRLGPDPSFGRVVILGGLGRCFLAAGQADMAVEHLRQSLEVGKSIRDDSREMIGLRSNLHLQLGEVLVALGRYTEAEEILESSLGSAKVLQDLHGQGIARCHLAAVAASLGKRVAARNHGQAALAAFRQLRDSGLEALAQDRLARACTPALHEDDPDANGGDADALPSQWAAADVLADFAITVFEDVTVEYAFEPDLLLDGRRERRVFQPAATSRLLADDACPTLLPGSRNYVDEEGSVRFALPGVEPVLDRRQGCIVMRRTAREIAIDGASRVLWKLVRALDGTATAGEIISGLKADERTAARCLLGTLADWGVVDVSGRPFGRYLHAATKKGVLPGGRLQEEQVRGLVVGGGYRTYEDAPRATLGTALPERLRAFHALTRARRSRRDYTGQQVSRQDFDALLNTACGVTGAMALSGRELKMRAYPSSGALYAVEIYPIVWRVEGLEAGVYHLRATENALETVRTDVDVARLTASALPVERDMVAGAAALVCLVGHFTRHEHKYGQGGYRMLVAEAGHVSQTLVLAATALGLAARPFGGVFDDLVNEDLGLDKEQEQFLLAVLVGHAGRDSPQDQVPEMPA